MDITYKVQLAASKNKLNTDLRKWAKISDFNFSKTDQWYRYYAGNYPDYQKALEVRKRYKDNGFPSAFIVAFKDGQKIKLEEAMSLQENP